MTALALPEPATITPAQIPDICRVVEAEALATDDVQLITEMHARWSAVTEYLALKSKDGIAQAEATKLRLLARIGELSPPSPGPGRGHHEKNPGTGNLSPNRLTEARQLAANPDVVDDVIAHATDDAPPTKAAALRQIRERCPRPPITPEEQERRDIEEANARARTRLQMLVNGWIELVAIGASPWRDEILAGLIDHDRDRVLEIEGIYDYWKAAHA